MEHLAVIEARDNLAEVLNRVAYAKSRVVLHRHGKELAAIVPLEDLETVLQHQRECLGKNAGYGRRQSATAKRR